MNICIILLDKEPGGEITIELVDLVAPWCHEELRLFHISRGFNL